MKQYIIIHYVTIYVVIYIITGFRVSMCWAYPYKGRTLFASKVIGFKDEVYVVPAVQKVILIP